jgi:serine/threonine protein kinase
VSFAVGLFGGKRGDRPASQVATADRVNEKIELCVAEHDFAAAAEIAQRHKQWQRAAKLWFRAANFVNSARALAAGGDVEGAIKLLVDQKEVKEAADIVARHGDPSRAADLFEASGDKHAAAQALVPLLRGLERGRFPPERLEIVRRVARLYAESGELERGIKVLRWSGQDDAAAELLVRLGHLDRAVALLRSMGKLQAAKELERHLCEEDENEMPDGPILLPGPPLPLMTPEQIKASIDLDGEGPIDLEISNVEKIVEMKPKNVEGVLIRGRFKIERLLGAGGQARVFRAKDSLLDRAVAIKVLNDEIAHDRSARERFLREARLAARVQHSKCIAIFDFGEENDLTFMAMELFDGVTLRELLDVTRLETKAVLQIACDVATALGAVHEHNIVHRDVKPANVLVDGGGHAKLGDFGIAYAIGEDKPMPGMVFGSAAYMAPEQARGGAVDARADVFAFGALLYEMLSGRKPFDSTTEGTIARLDAPPPDLDDAIVVPSLLRSIMRRCMRARPNDRYASAALVLTELKAVMAEIEALEAEDPFLKNTSNFGFEDVTAEASTDDLDPSTGEVPQQVAVRIPDEITDVHPASKPKKNEETQEMDAPTVERTIRPDDDGGESWENNRVEGFNEDKTLTG